MNGLAGLGILTPDNLMQTLLPISVGGIGDTAILLTRVTSATKTFRVFDRKSTRSVARQAKDNGEEEHRRMEGERGNAYYRGEICCGKNGARLNYLLIPIKTVLL
jgi:hypothetical protein